MAEDTSLYERFGAAALPLKASDVTDGVFPDPVRAIMLALYQSAINAELARSGDDLWAEVVANTTLAGKSPVVATFPQLPLEEIMKQRKADLPHLFLGRVGAAEYSDLGTDKEERTQEWHLSWIIGTLTAEEINKLEPTWTSFVPMIVNQVTRHKCHASFLSGQQQFGPGRGDLSSIQMTGTDSTPASWAAEGPKYYGCTMTLVTTETENAVDDAFTDLDGMSADIAVGGRDGTIPNIVRLDTRFGE